MAVNPADSMSLIVAAITAAAGAVGALIGFAGSLLMNRSANQAAAERMRIEHQQEDRTRFHSLRVELYGKLLAAAADCRDRTLTVHSLYRHLTNNPSEEGAALDALIAARGNVRVTGKTVELIAYARTRAAAVSLCEAAIEVSAAPPDELAFDPPRIKLDPRIKALDEAEQLFSEAARVELLPPEELSA